MAFVRPKRCRDCHKLASRTVHISHRGLCQPCALDRMERGVRFMKAKSGPVYDRWRENLVRALTK